MNFGIRRDDLEANVGQETLIQPVLTEQIAEAQLKIGLQVAGVGLVRFNYKTDQATLSPEAAVMYGIPADELTISRDRLHSTFHPEELDELHALIQQILDPAGNGWFAREHRVVWHNGEVRWLNVRKQVFFEQVGETFYPHSAILAAVDITERKRVELALKESEDRFRTLADNISQLAWMADENGWIFWYNRRWFEYTGTSLAEMEGWGWQKVHHPDYIDRVVQRFRRSVVELGESWEDTFPLRGQDGIYRWFLSRAFPIRDETGKIVRWFGTNTDVTELKTIQAELENRNDELDNFVHIVSHDLKAPLRGISSLSQWIEEDLTDLLTPETQQQMQLLRQRVQRMSVMIDGLLDYARVGMTEEDIETVAVAELVLEVIDSIAPPDHFQIKLDPLLPTLETRRLLLFQVFANLISNAIKHHDGDDGEIQITVTEQNHHYQFRVTDNGPGILEEYQSGIFTIFRTGKPGTNTDSTGVGLAIVKKIIESQGGSIQLESQVGQGTTFQFTWPK
jgi:PAS domain S-box-containing protein